MKDITVEQIMSWGPCDDYPEPRVLELFGDHKSVTPIEILDYPGIPVADRLWVLLREDIIPARELREFACDCAERVLPLWDARYPDDARPRDCIAVARRYARGEATKKELDAGCAAAYAAADAFASAAYAAYAAMDAAYVAAYVAAYAAADAAEREREWQVERLREVLSDMEVGK